jgi:hypothetical protein
VSPRTAALAFVALGAAHLAVGAWMLFAPGSFYDAIGTFPPRNDHFIGEVGAYYVALGVTFVAAARRATWRGGVLLLAVVQYALHLGAHLYDIDDPPEDWVGPVSAALVGAGLLVLVAIAFAARRRGGT